MRMHWRSVLGGAGALLVVLGGSVLGSSDSLVASAVAASKSFDEAMRTGEGECTVRFEGVTTHGADGQKLSGFARYVRVVNVRFVMDDQHIRTDMRDVRNEVNGVDGELVERVGVEDDRVRKEYKPGEDYAYVHAKTDFPSGIATLRCDPRDAFLPQGHRLADWVAEAEARGGAVETEAKDEVVRIRFKEADGSQEAVFDVNVQSGGILAERYYRDGVLGEDVERQFRRAETDMGVALVPERVRLRAYNPDGGLVSEREMVFASFHFRDRVSQAEFTWRGMGVPEHARIVDRTAGDAMYVLGGEAHIQDALDTLVAGAAEEEAGGTLGSAAGDAGGPSVGVAEGPSDSDGPVGSDPMSAAHSDGRRGSKAALWTGFACAAVILCLLVGVQRWRRHRRERGR